MVDVDKSKVQPFQSSAAFSKWLEVHHATESELWLKIYKKSSGIETITWNEAVIEGLCWGWIDGIKKSLDDDAYLQRFTPRRKRSNWSKRNREHVESLIKEGRMHKPGLIHVTAAKADGRWEDAYPPQSEMQMPEDFLAAVEANSVAREIYKTLNKSSLFVIACQLHSAKKPETRQRRFEKYLLMLINNEKLK